MKYQKNVIDGKKESAKMAKPQIQLGSGPWFNKKMSSYQYRKYHCRDETILRPSYLHNGISYTGKMTYFYWIRPLLILHSRCIVWVKSNTAPSKADPVVVFPWCRLCPKTSQPSQAHTLKVTPLKINRLLAMTKTTCTWNLRLKFQNKLELHSRNHTS